MKAKLIKALLSVWPPLVGSGISVMYYSDDHTEALVSLKMHWYNANIVKTHFGGSLYAMTDPFYMLLLMNQLGKEYIVWDKAAEIEFISPARSTVTAHFKVDETVVSEIKKKTESGKPYHPEFMVNVRNRQGETVARVTKTLYVRKRMPTADSKAL